MKIELTICLCLVIFVACDNDKKPSPCQTAAIQSTKIYSSNSKTQISNLDTTIIPEEEYGNIETALKNCSIPEKERRYLEIALQTEKKFAEIKRQGTLDDSTGLSNNREALEKFAKQNNLDATSIHSLRNMQLSHAIQHLKVFRLAGTLSRPARDEMLNNGGFFSISFSGQGSGFPSFKQSLIDNSYDGIRIYLAKYNPKFNPFPTGSEQSIRIANKEYTLIIVGTLGGKDQVDLAHPDMNDPNILDYGQPCKPNCGTGTSRLDLLGREAGDQ